MIIASFWLSKYILFNLKQLPRGILYAKVHALNYTRINVDFLYTYLSVYLITGKYILLYKVTIFNLKF